MSGTTIAFSMKTGSWTTRYSFAPTCYATIDDKLLSFPETGVEGGSNLCWEHDVNETRNLFYGVQQPMELSVVANPQVSQNKAFKAMSVEGNANSWSIGFSTNENPAGSSQLEFQSSFLGPNSLKRKGSVSYSNIPFSAENSTSNLDYFGAVDGLLDGLNILNTSGQSVCVLAGAAGSAVPITSNTRLLLLVDGALKRLGVQADTGSGISLYDYSKTQLQSLRSDAIRILSYDLENNRVNLAFSENDRSEITSVLLNAGLTGRVQIYFENPSQIDGDPMKGHYLKMDLKLDAADAALPVEVFSINTQYEDDPLNATLI